MSLLSILIVDLFNIFMLNGLLGRLFGGDSPPKAGFPKPSTEDWPAIKNTFI